MPIAGLYKIFDHWHQEGTLYIYSDPHFNDPDLKKGIVRPDADELIRRINAKCGRKDTFICLGDIVDIEPVRKIRAQYKILICGNHDRGVTNYQRIKGEKIYSKSEYSNFLEVKSAASAEYPNYQFSISQTESSWVVHYDNMLFDEVYDGVLTIGEKLILSHEPVDVPWAFNIHGHVHDRRHKNDKNHFNCCADVINYEPINFNQWMKSGYLAHIDTIHRETIDAATVRKAKRGGKKIGEK